MHSFWAVQRQRPCCGYGIASTSLLSILGGLDPAVFGRFDLAALVQPHLKSFFCLFVCLESIHGMQGIWQKVSCDNVIPTGCCRGDSQCIFYHDDDMRCHQWHLIYLSRSLCSVPGPKVITVQTSPTCSKLRGLLMWLSVWLVAIGLAVIMVGDLC